MCKILNFTQNSVVLVLANKNYDVIMSSFSTVVNKYSNHETVSWLLYLFTTVLNDDMITS